jgi:hypothetical protein
MSAEPSYVDICEKFTVREVNEYKKYIAEQKNTFKEIFSYILKGDPFEIFLSNLQGVSPQERRLIGQNYFSNKNYSNNCIDDQCKFASNINAMNDNEDCKIPLDYMPPRTNLDQASYSLAQLDELIHKPRSQGLYFGQFELNPNITKEYVRDHLQCELGCCWNYRRWSQSTAVDPTTLYFIIHELNQMNDSSKASTIIHVITLGFLGNPLVDVDYVRAFGQLGAYEIATLVKNQFKWNLTLLKREYILNEIKKRENTVNEAMNMPFLTKHIGRYLGPL